MQAERQQGWLYRLLRRDVGRKLTALFFAFVLYTALDQQLQSSYSFPVRFEFVDRAGVKSAQDLVPEGQIGILIVRHDSSHLIVPADERARLADGEFKINVEGRKDLLELMQGQSPSFQYYLKRDYPEGSALVTLDELTNAERLQDFPQVEITPEIEFRVERIEDVTVELVGSRHVKVNGTAAGFEVSQDESDWEFSNSVILRGPLEVVQRIRSGVLFKPINVAGETDRRIRRDLEPDLPEDVEMLGADDLKVTLQLREDLVPVPEELGGVFDRPVSIYFDEKRFLQMYEGDPTRFSQMTTDEEGATFVGDPEDWLEVKEIQFFNPDRPGGSKRIRLQLLAPQSDVTNLAGRGEMDRKQYMADKTGRVLTHVRGVVLDRRQNWIRMDLSRLTGFPEGWGVEFYRSDDTADESNSHNGEVELMWADRASNETSTQEDSTDGGD